MRRILICVMLLGLFATMAVAADNSTAGQAEGAPAAQKPEPLTAMGSLWQNTVGEKFIRDTGIKVDFAFDAGFSTNNTINSKYNTTGASASNPNAEPGATGFTLSQAQMRIHRDPVSNLIIGVTPIPGPTPKKIDWGFEFDTSYGSDGLPCNIAGWDAHWGVNEPGASNHTNSAYGRQYYLCTPMVNGTIYLPIWKGMEVKFGRQPSGISFEIPPDVPWPMGPNFFDSHSYSAYSDMMEVVGVTASINVMRSQKSGYLAIEFGANNGEQSFHSAASAPLQNFMADVRWRAPHMNTWIDFETTFGPNNVAVNAAGNQLSSTDFGAAAMSTQIQSRTNQTEWRNVLAIQHEFGKRWKLAVEGTYGKQYSDGKATTAVLWQANQPNAAVPLAGTICGPAGFGPGNCPYPGASYEGVDGTLTYQINKNWAWGVRAEHFNDGLGQWLYPLDVVLQGSGSTAYPVAVGGAVNDVTFGINYKPIKFITLRPEVRYDWQSGSQKLNLFGGANCVGEANCPTSRTQVTATLNAVFWF